MAKVEEFESSDHTPSRINYQPPQYKSNTRRIGQHLHGFVTNHQGDWAPALHSKEYRDNFDKIKWNKENR